MRTELLLKQPLHTLCQFRNCAAKHGGRAWLEKHGVFLAPRMLHTDLTAERCLTQLKSRNTGMFVRVDHATEAVLQLQAQHLPGVCGWWLLCTTRVECVEQCLRGNTDVRDGAHLKYHGGRQTIPTDLRMVH